MNQIIFVLAIILFVFAIYIIYKYVFKTTEVDKEILKKPFPDEWRRILNQRVLYYKNLPPDKKKEFEERVKKFLAHIKINGAEGIKVTDTDKLLVASSAVIPLFAFPHYNYPNVSEVVLYPHSFDEKFNTNNASGQRNILGMIGDGYMNGVVILSKPDLEAAFDGTRHRNNVGIHEFVHLIDKADGSVDGVPEVLFTHSYSLPWIKEIKKEMQKIKTGHSDINPYALTNNAEFLAVVSEYFFDNPEKMKSRHPELYNILSEIYKQHPDDYV